MRRAVAARGFTPATWIPAASEGRAEQASIRPARLLESLPLTGVPVGPPEPWPGSVAFLDGTQRYEVMAYGGASPVVVAEIAVAVMERRERRLHVALVERRRLMIARPAGLAQLEGLTDDHATVALPDEGPVHPVLDFQLARREVDAARGRLEVEVGRRYRTRSANWLVVDGSLTESPHWAADARMLGVSKSHATLPFGGAELEAYLRLAPGQRSPVFAPPGHDIAPVYSWALRLWPWEGRDLLHGLVRIEAAPTDETLARVDELSRWLLAERTPVTTPDPRWDRLLYGIHQVEEYLRASSGR
jgi:hypothetical protein